MPVGLNTCASVGVGTGREGRSHCGAHRDTYAGAGGSEAGARSRPRAPWVSGVGGSRLRGSSSHTSALRGCWGLAAKSQRRRALPRASGRTSPRSSPPPPGMAPGMANEAPLYVGVGWGGDVHGQGGVLGSIISPGHRSRMCIALTPGEGAQCALPVRWHGQGGSGGHQPLGTVALFLCPWVGITSLPCNQDHRVPSGWATQQREAGCGDARWG